MEEVVFILRCASQPAPAPAVAAEGSVSECAASTNTTPVASPAGAVVQPYYVVSILQNRSIAQHIGQDRPARTPSVDIAIAVPSV
jgi:hypothetical protein